MPLSGWKRAIYTKDAAISLAQQGLTPHTGMLCRDIVQGPFDVLSPVSLNVSPSLFGLVFPRFSVVVVLSILAEGTSKIFYDFYTILLQTPSILYQNSSNLCINALRP